MTAVPPRPAADTRCTCGGTWPCTGPAWMGDHSPERITSADGVVAPDATTGDGLRARAERIVANWRVNFDHDDDRPLVNMIDAALRDVLAAAARDAEAVARVRELAAKLTQLEDVAYVDLIELALDGTR